ncbi:MAG: hypothetical protein ACI92E_000085 [Oceanicoccus sp.]|jgi:hypothetical protein
MKLINLTLLLILFVLTPAAYAGEANAQQTKNDVMAVLDEFIETFSAKDPALHVATYHFPHFRLAQGEMSSWNTASEAAEMHKLIFKNLQNAGWDKSIWNKREIVNMSSSKVHVSTRFTRLRNDGSEIGSYNSLYILIKKNGRWAIKMRSSFL